jgi:hypothetical protein
MTKKLTKEHLRKIIKEELQRVRFLKNNKSNQKKKKVYKESCDICTPEQSDGLCPICGDKITIESETPQGQLVGSCGDIFYPEEFEGMSDLGDLGDEYKTDLFEEDESGKKKLENDTEEKLDKETPEDKKDSLEDKSNKSNEPKSGTVIAQDDEGFLVVG